MMSNIEKSHLGRLRVLIVENRQGIRDLFQNRLPHWGYEPVIAEGEGLALIDDAKRKARSECCHLALIDKRLIDDGDPSDVSGLDLIKDIKITAPIMLTAYTDHETTRMALIERGAFDVIEKTEPKSVRSCLDRAAREVWKQRRINWVRPPELESATLVNQFFPNDGSYPHGEVDDVLYRLFPEGSRIKLESMGGADRTPSVHLRQRSIVMKAFIDGATRPLIIKIVRAGRASKEVDNLRKISGSFRSGRYALIRGEPLELWNIGGMIYEIVGDDEQHPATTFAEYYINHSDKNIAMAIRNFARFWKPIYTLRLDGSERQSLFKAYNEVWGDEWLERLIQYQELPEGITYLDLFGQIGLPNPVKWLIRRVQLNDSGQYQDGGVPDTELAICHGDLHSSNLFVDTRKDVWVIDYERTGSGPILQDWVELENDILTNLVSGVVNQAGLSAYVQLLCDILEPKVLGARGVTTKLPNLFSKEYSAVKTIRNSAKKCSQATDARQYYWGLLLNALFRGTLLMKEYEELTSDTATVDKDKSEKQRQELHTQILLNLVFAAMNCHRLEHWDKPWPPIEWKQVFLHSRVVKELPTSNPQFERIIKETIPLIDPEPWMHKHHETLSRICRIEIPDGQGKFVFGTGFLIAADLVMTNYHVAESLIRNLDTLQYADLASDVRFRFDYRLASNERILKSPTICKLATENWLIDYSLYAAEGCEPTLDSLDYAILKLKRTIGNESVGGDGRQRGWISLFSQDDGLMPKAPMVIVQHPEGKPLKLAIDTEAVIRENQAGTVVQYRTNTKPGSSGSPCFDLNWNLVALHHSGDPSWRPTYNAGTPIRAIIQRLRQRGLGNLVEGSV